MSENIYTVYCIDDRPDIFCKNIGNLNAVSGYPGVPVTDMAQAQLKALKALQAVRVGTSRYEAKVG